MLFKNTLVKMKKSFGRYFSLFLIVAVGVGFYAGVQEAAPSISGVAAAHYSKHALMDFRVVSTLGLTENDAQALRALPNAADAVPSYSLDVLNGGKTLRVHALEGGVNNVRLLSGRLPEKEGECVADGRFFQIGDIITPEGEHAKDIKSAALTVTGTVESVLYLSEDYGNTGIGDGRLFSYIFISKTEFLLEAYTEIYLLAKGAAGTGAYTNAYKQAASVLQAEITGLQEEREQARYQEIYNKANKLVSENRELFNKEKTEGEAKLESAKKELDDGAAKLSEGKQELQKGRETLQTEKDKQNKAFAAAQAELEGGRKQFNAALAQAGISEKDLAEKIGQLNAAIAQLEGQLALLPAESPDYQAAAAALAGYKGQQEGLFLLSQTASQLAKGEQELSKGRKLFAAEMEKAEKSLAEGEKELAEKEAQVQDGYKEYEENLQLFNAEIASGAQKLSNAEKELAEIKPAQWHIFSRADVAGYSFLESSIGVVNSVAAVIPLFFAAIVVLMASNSMARMIAEERGEIGTLLSLGYGRGRITGTYLFYVLSATLFGAVAGYFAGVSFIPHLIYQNFQNILPPLTVRYSMLSFLIILAAAAALMVGVTLFACNKELKEKPARLMRPVPPAKGQGILLEKLPFLWNRLSFSWKVTVRNLFRYKKRGVMTVVGVAGCTALLLAGFGLKNSMEGIAEKQYGEIFTYNHMMVLKEEAFLLPEKLQAILEEEKTEPLLLKQAALSAQTDAGSMDAYLLVPENSGGFNRYFHLSGYENKAPLSLAGNGVILTQKLADVLGAKEGSVIAVTDAQNHSYRLPVAGLAENYTENYIYMDAALHAELMGPVSYNTVLGQSSGEGEEGLARRLTQSGLVANVVFTKDLAVKVGEASESLQGIIVLLVGVASLLALVVLYNLTSINISERTREIASLKVLGFYAGETDAYINREAFLLTLVSIGVGLGLGVLLHRYVVVLVEGANMVFFKEIKWYSYVLAGVITLLFSLVMQAVTHFKLKKIDMTQSLKSVE